MVSKQRVNDILIRLPSICGLAAILLCLMSTPPATAQVSGPHFLHNGSMPPGVIGQGALMRTEPLQGFYQPVDLRTPSGSKIAFAEEGLFGEAYAAPAKAGLLIGQVYRFRVTNIPRHPGMEVFPSIEVIDRLYAPDGEENRFPIMVDVTQEDLELALAGKYVTRVIYLEDPRTALPVSSDKHEQAWFDVGVGRDPLVMADELGRPMAILRLGARVPDSSMGPDMAFLFGCPPLVQYGPSVMVLSRPPRRGPVLEEAAAATRLERR